LCDENPKFLMLNLFEYYELASERLMTEYYFGNKSIKYDLLLSDSIFGAGIGVFQ
jgi:hypothetical protein